MKVSNKNFDNLAKFSHFSKIGCIFLDVSIKKLGHGLNYDTQKEDQVSASKGKLIIANLNLKLDVVIPPFDELKLDQYENRQQPVKVFPSTIETG